MSCAPGKPLVCPLVYPWCPCVCCRLVWAVLPPGNDPLRGTEVDMICQFKASLGLEDEDAAGVHIEIGRRIFRQRMETGDKDAAIEERKTFQKLVYVSDLVFGPKARFLLPWKRIFKVSDSQVEVAVRNNAQELFQLKLEASRAEPDVAVLRELRAQQKKFKLPDEVRGHSPARNVCFGNSMFADFIVCTHRRCSFYSPFWP